MRSHTSRIVSPLTMAVLREVSPVKPAGALWVPPRGPRRPGRALRPPGAPVRPPDSSAAFVRLRDRTNAASPLRDAVPTQAPHYAALASPLVRSSQVWADRRCLPDVALAAAAPGNREWDRTENTPAPPARHTARASFPGLASAYSGR